MRIIAEKQKRLVEEILLREKQARTEAENNLNLYLKQKNLANLYIEHLQDSYSKFLNTDFFMPQTNLGTFQMMYNIAKLMAMKNPDNRRSLQLLGKYQFYKCNFAEALKLLDKRRSRMIEVSKIMIKKHLSKHYLKLPEYKILFSNIAAKKLPSSNEHILRFVRLAELKCRPDIANIIKLALQTINPDISQLKWNLKSLTLTIKTHNTNLVIPEKEGFSIIDPLNPSKIIIYGKDCNIKQFPRKLRNKIEFVESKNAL